MFLKHGRHYRKTHPSYVIHRSTTQIEPTAPGSAPCHECDPRPPKLPQVPGPSLWGTSCNYSQSLDLHSTSRREHRSGHTWFVLTHPWLALWCPRGSPEWPLAENISAPGKTFQICRDYHRRPPPLCAVHPSFPGPLIPVNNHVHPVFRFSAWCPPPSCALLPSSKISFLTCDPLSRSWGHVSCKVTSSLWCDGGEEAEPGSGGGGGRAGGEDLGVPTGHISSHLQMEIMFPWPA